MTKETLNLLLQVLNQITIKVGDEKFEETTTAIVKAKKELLEALENA